MYAQPVDDQKDQIQGRQRVLLAHPSRHPLAHLSARLHHHRHQRGQHNGTLLYRLLVYIYLFFYLVVVAEGDPLPDNYRLLREVVDDWIAGDAAVIAKYGELPEWDTSRVTNMTALFQNKSTFNADISKWDISQVATMHEIFKGASSFDRTICGNKWVTLNAFADGNGRSGCCPAGSYMSNPHTNPFDPVGSCTLCGSTTWHMKTVIENSDLACPNLHDMVRAYLTNETKSTTKFGPIEDWDTQNVVEMRQLFCSTADCGPRNKGPSVEQFNADISKWKIGKVKDMFEMFYVASAFNADISKWNTARVTNMNYIFHKASAFNRDLSTWNVERVTNMGFAFYYAKKFNSDISTWNTTKVTSMYKMFYYSTAFNNDISKWDTSNVINMNYMFVGAFDFNQAIGQWDTSKLTSMYQLFYDARAFNQDLSSWKTVKVKSMVSMFEGARAFNHDVSKWNTGAVTNMNHSKCNPSLHFCAI